MPCLATVAALRGERTRTRKSGDRHRLRLLAGWRDRLCSCLTLVVIAAFTELETSSSAADIGTVDSDEVVEICAFMGLVFCSVRPHSLKSGESRAGIMESRMGSEVGDVMAGGVLSLEERDCKRILSGFA